MLENRRKFFENYWRTYEDEKRELKELERAFFNTQRHFETLRLEFRKSANQEIKLIDHITVTNLNTTDFQTNQRSLAMKLTMKAFAAATNER